jgi:hypothetical protein
VNAAVGQEKDEIPYPGRVISNALVAGYQGDGGLCPGDPDPD